MTAFSHDDRLLSHLQPGEEREIGARALDWASQASRRGEPVATDFFDPYQRQIIASVLGSLVEVSFRAYGGYPRAERRRLLVYPEHYLDEMMEAPISVLDLEVTSPFSKLSHRGFLGALLSTGLKREKVGDIVVTDRGAQVVVAKESVDFILTSLTRVGNSPVRIQEIDPEQMEVEPERVKEIRTTVASLRLDAVAAAGYGASRTRMAREIRAERVKLNWKPVTSPSHEVSEGDVLSIRGRGRVVVEEVKGTTRKGRTSLVLKRYM